MNERPQRVTLRWTLAGRTALLLALCGLAVTVPLGSQHALFPALLLAAFAVSGPIAWLALRRVQVRACEHRSVRTGQRFEFPLALGCGRGGLTPRDLVVHAGADGPTSSRQLAFVAELERGGEFTWSACEWRTRRRGPVRKLALRIASEYPLGLWRATAHVELEVDWLSLPRIAALRFDPAQRTRRWRERSLDTHSRRGDEEFYALRDARPGDSPHRIHWRSSARRGKTVVRELRGEERPEASVVLAGWVEHAPLTGRQHEGFEQAISLAAALVERRARTGEATLVRFDGPQPWSMRVAPTRSGVQSLLARLALVECGVQPGGFESLRNAAKRALAEGAFVIHAWPAAGDIGRTLQRADRNSALVVTAHTSPRSGVRA